MLLELFTYHFFQRAFLAGVFLACSASLLGLFLILRKDAMLGHGLTHTAFAGVALGLFFHVSPFPVALAVSTLAAFLILEVRERAGLYGDTAIAILSSLGIAIGVILATLGRSFNVNLLSFLFGNILAVGRFELYGSVILSLAVLLSLIFFYHELIFVTFDEESAKASGLPVAKLDALLALLTAITVVIGMKVVGLLLISALLVLPGAAALQLCNTFRQTSIVAAILALFSVCGGLIIAGLFNLPASGSIILLGGFIFALCFLLKRLK